MSMGFFHNDRARLNKMFCMEFCIPTKSQMIQLPSLVGKYNKKKLRATSKEETKKRNKKKEKKSTFNQDLK